MARKVKVACAQQGPIHIADSRESVVARLLEMLRDLWPGVQSVRMAGSAALGVAYAAAGRFELYVHHYVQPWDIAPGLLLVREAGGIATDLRGAYGMPASGCIIAAAPGVHAAFLAATDGMPWRASQQPQQT